MARLPSGWCRVADGRRGCEEKRYRREGTLAHLDGLDGTAELGNGEADGALMLLKSAGAALVGECPQPVQLLAHHCLQVCVHKQPGVPLSAESFGA